MGDTDLKFQLERRRRKKEAELEDKARESRVQSVCTTAILTVLHPRTYFSINLQELQDDGCLESVCLNAACLALLDASVPLKFLLASVTVLVTEEGSIICDPTSKQLSAGVASATFVFSNRNSGDQSASIVSSYSDVLMDCSRVTPSGQSKSVVVSTKQIVIASEQ